MVKNTLAPICEKKTPEEIKDIQIADIACGSGIFLEEAYQFLVDYCTECVYAARFKTFIRVE